MTRKMPQKWMTRTEAEAAESRPSRADATDEAEGKAAPAAEFVDGAERSAVAGGQAPVRPAGTPWPKTTPSEARAVAEAWVAQPTSLLGAFPSGLQGPPAGARSIQVSQLSR